VLVFRAARPARTEPIRMIPDGSGTGELSRMFVTYLVGVWKLPRSKFRQKKYAVLAQGLPSRSTYPGGLRGGKVNLPRNRSPRWCHQFRWKMFRVGVYQPARVVLGCNVGAEGIQPGDRSYQRVRNSPALPIFFSTCRSVTVLLGRTASVTRARRAGVRLPPRPAYPWRC
jgi:hypothetical protein